MKEAKSYKWNLSERKYVGVASDVEMVEELGTGVVKGKSLSTIVDLAERASGIQEMSVSYYNTSSWG